MPEELWIEIHDTVQEAAIKNLHKKKKCNKAKWLSEDTLQIAEERREGKSKGERKRSIQLNAGQKTTVRTRHGKLDCFQIGEAVHKG